MFGSNVFSALDFFYWRVVSILLESVSQEHFIANSKAQNALLPNSELNDSALTLQSFVNGGSDAFRPMFLKFLKHAHELVPRISIFELELL